MSSPFDNTIKTESLRPLRPEAKSTAKKPDASAAQDKPEELRQACQQFEEIFLRMILKEAHLDRILANGEEEEKANLYGDLLIENLARSVAQGGGLGISEMLYQQLSPEVSPASDGEQLIGNQTSEK